jgi:hypothetical protein
VNYRISHFPVCILLLAGQCAVAQERGREIGYQQPKEFTCTGVDGTYPSPGECTDIYYVCSGGIADAQV